MFCGKEQKLNSLAFSSTSNSHQRRRRTQRDFLCMIVVAPILCRAIKMGGGGGEPVQSNGAWRWRVSVLGLSQTRTRCEAALWQAWGVVLGVVSPPLPRLPPSPAHQAAAFPPPLLPPSNSLLLPLPPFPTRLLPAPPPLPHSLCRMGTSGQSPTSPDASTLHWVTRRNLLLMQGSRCSYLEEVSTPCTSEQDEAAWKAGRGGGGYGNGHVCTVHPQH